MSSKHRSYLKEAFREAARREFADVLPETGLVYEFSDGFEKRILSLFNNTCSDNAKSRSFIELYDVPSSVQDKEN